MNDSNSKSRDNNPGKRCNEAAAAANNDGSSSSNTFSCIGGGFEDDGMKISASATSHRSLRSDNKNETDDPPFSSSGFHTAIDLKPPAKETPSAAAAAIDDDYPSSKARLDTEQDDKKVSSTARGRPLQRNHEIDNIGFPSSTAFDNGFVPLKVIHVPNNKNHYNNNNNISATGAAITTAASSSSNAASFDATKRAPSVPDLTSLLHCQNHDSDYYYRRQYRSTTTTTITPPLSDVILKIKERGDQKQQFEERLRRAHLRLSSDNNVRYRSKSTPSRGGAGGGNEMTTWGGYNDSLQHMVDERRRQSDSGHHDSGTNEEQHVACQNQMTRTERRHSPTPLGEIILHSSDVHSRSADALNISSNDIIPPPSPPLSSSVKSSGISVTAAGSHLSHDGSFDDRNTIMPEPPPPPPPTTERERLVERERQARLETERARRRYIALQRERQLEEQNNDDDNDNDGDDSFDNDGRSDDRNALIIGQISFEDEERNGGLPSPPIPPPPATEKERLVERERQARLETERARRRHLAFQREQQLEIAEQLQLDNDSHDYPDAIPDNRFNNIDDEAPVEALAESFVLNPIAASRDIIGSREASTESVVSSDTRHGSGAKAVTQNNDAEATSLSYPMERFLETLGDESAIASNVEILPTVENDESSLPYTMELFLAENAAGVSGDSRNENETHIEHHSDGNIMTNSFNMPQPPSSTLSTGEASGRRLMRGNIITADFDEAVDLTTESSVHSGAFVGGPLGGNESLSRSDNHSHPPSELRVSNPPSQSSEDTLDSPELTSRPSRPITEADIAQLAEVEHASIGNAAPQSERDEPSEASIPRRTLTDHAFSVATQTTVIDSVAETSLGRSHIMSEANQSRDSSTIIRVGSVETGSSGGASSASIEAVPSNVSEEDSDDDSHMIINPPSIRSQSLGDGSNLSPDINRRMPELTEADVVALAEIDYASIGNAPPLSVRDERLSESSVTERGGRQFSVATPISEMDSIDENSILRGSPFRSIIDEDSESNLSIPERDSRMSNESENISVEVMPSDRSDDTGSHNSIEVMLSEHDDDSLHDIRSVTDTDDMASSTSIEASPSVDLESNLRDVNGHNGLAMYGATSEADDDTANYNTLNPSFSYDEESPFLIPPQPSPSPADSSHLHSGDKSARGDPDTIGHNTKMLIFLVAEIPHFIIVRRGGNLLCRTIGKMRYQIILATLIVLASLYSHFRSDKTRADWPLNHAHLKEMTFIGVFIGIVALIMSGLDFSFALGISCSVAAANAASTLCECFVVVVLKSCTTAELRELAVIACGDFIRSFTLLSISYVIFNVVAPVNVEQDDMC